MDRSYWWWPQGKGNGFPDTLPFRGVCTSTGFLRLLRSLAILAFLSCFRFFSSRSLSPSLLEELAEALLSNLPRRGGFRLRVGGQHPSTLGKERNESKATGPEGKRRTTTGPPPPVPNPASSPSLTWLQPSTLQTQP